MASQQDSNKGGYAQGYPQTTGYPGQSGGYAQQYPPQGYPSQPQYQYPPPYGQYQQPYYGNQPGYQQPYYGNQQPVYVQSQQNNADQTCLEACLAALCVCFLCELCIF